MINENASEPNKFDQCVNVSTVVKSGNCSASLKSKNVVNVSGVLNKFARLIGSSAMPESRNAFVSLFSSLLSFDDDEDDYDDFSEEDFEEGAVKWFNTKKGYGFITRDQGDDIFVHFRNIKGQGRRSLTDGERVTFVVTEGDKGLQADHVSPVA